MQAVNNDTLMIHVIILLILLSCYFVRSYKIMLPLPKLYMIMFKKVFATFTGIMFATLVWSEPDVRAVFYADGAEEKEQYRSHNALEAVESGASVVYATNGVDLYLTRMRMSKTSGSISGADHRVTGMNSVILADGGSKVMLDACDVNSHTPEADGVSSSGDGTVVTVMNGSLNMSRAGSAAVNATNKGKIEVVKANVVTYSNQSPSFYAGSEGVVEVTEAKGDNGGQASPLFYSSSGNIKAEKCRMSAGKWTIGSVDNGLIELNDNELKAGSVCGFLVYGADGKDRERRSSGKLILKNNNITVTEGPLLFVTNAMGEISLSGNKISCRNDEIICIKADEWGVKGSNQGQGTIDVEKQTLKGDIYVDSISTLKLVLNKGAKLNGSITGMPSDRREVRVTMGKGSVWTVKGDVYLTDIMFEQPIEKGLKQIKGKHVIYYDPDLSTGLGGKEYKTGGGVLKPMKRQ